MSALLHVASDQQEQESLLLQGGLPGGNNRWVQDSAWMQAQVDDDVSGWMPGVEQSKLPGYVDPPPDISTLYQSEWAYVAVEEYEGFISDMWPGIAQARQELYPFPFIMALDLDTQTWSDPLAWATGTLADIASWISAFAQLQTPGYVTDPPPEISTLLQSEWAYVATEEYEGFTEDIWPAIAQLYVEGPPDPPPDISVLLEWIDPDIGSIAACPGWQAPHADNSTTWTQVRQCP